MKKIVLAGILVAIIAVVGRILWLNNREPVDDDVVIITTYFPEYDVARAIAGDGVKMLLKPGGDIHHFEPTPQDVVDVERADLVLYGGGESEEWMDDLLEDNDVEDARILSLLDVVEPELNGDEYDEHIWTNPQNMIKIAEAVRDKLSEIWPNRAAEFTKKAEQYITELNAVDDELNETVKDARVRTLVVADRFPFYYFAKAYGLDYIAALPGCAEQTEASSKTVAELIDKVRKDKISAVLKIELSNGKLAETVASETGAKVLELNSAHNVSQEDFDNEVTYVDIMRRNAAVLKEALK